MNDRFCFYGSILRLKPRTSPYGAPDSLYVSELDDTALVAAHGTQGNGPQYFVMHARNGQKFEYGRTDDSQVFPGVQPRIATTPVRWMLYRASDRSGNSYSISYVNRDGFAIPSTISWARSTRDATNYKYEARFKFSNRRLENDSYNGRIAGYQVSNRHRLESIQVKVAGIVKRQYFFNYDLAATNSRTRLVAVIECFEDAEASCSSPVTFIYPTSTADKPQG